MKPVEIQSINLEKQMIKKVIFLNVRGSDKMLIFFDSGEILELPVHRQCPSVLYTKQEFELNGKKAMIDMLNNQMEEMAKEISDKIKAIKEI